MDIILIYLFNMFLIFMEYFFTYLFNILNGQVLFGFSVSSVVVLFCCLGIIGSPETWIKYPWFIAGVLEHEFGHDMELSHQLESTYERITNKTKYGSIEPQHDGESRMGCGRTVHSTSESSQYKSNGHFGWLIHDTNIIDISFEDDFGNIPNDDIFTINAYDRPDIIRNVFLIRIKYGSEFDDVGDVKMNVVYVYHCTSYIDADNINSQGASVQYCVYDNYYNWYECGTNILTCTMDVQDATYIQIDDYIPTSGLCVTRRHGCGNLELSVSGDNANIQTFVYDQCTWATVNNDVNDMDQLGIGSLMTFSILGDFETCSNNSCKIQAVQVAQNGREWVHIDEIQVYEFNGMLSFFRFLFLLVMYLMHFFFTFVLFAFSHQKNRH